MLTRTYNYQYACIIFQVPLPESQRYHLPVVASGVLDAIAAWFELCLDQEVSFSTGPTWDISWEQAVFPLPLSNPTCTCMLVKKKKLYSRCRDGKTTETRIGMEGSFHCYCNQRYHVKMVAYITV